MEKEIHPQTQITIDEDVSQEKLGFLVQLAIEEERLDFKENLDFSDKPKGKKSKIDLTADIIAISNTDGGYIIVGIKEHPKGHFSLEGANEENLKQITQENIVNFLKNYVDHLPKIIVRAHEINGARLILTFVGKSKTLIPFKQDGQFGENERKFSAGDIFVRHGAISTKANYQDIQRFVENIKTDERKLLNVQGKGTAQIINRLDTLISVFTGTRPSFNDFDIYDNSLEAIEDYTFNLSLDSRNDPIIKRFISKYFKKIKQEIINLEQEQNEDELTEKIKITLPPLFEKIIPLWNSLNENAKTKITFKLTDEVYELWQLTFKLQGHFSKTLNHKLLIQTEIIKLVYILLAIAIKNNNNGATRFLVRRKAESEYGEHRNSYWFRYILTWLSRTGQLKFASLVNLTYDSFKDNTFINTIFDSNESLLKYLCQADFIQCLNSLNDKETHERDCWPSFRLHKKIYITPIIEDIINNNNNKWIDQVTNSELVGYLEHFETFQSGEIWGNWNWNTGYTESEKLKELYKSVKDGNAH